MTAKTNTQKQQELRDRRTALGLKRIEAVTTQEQDVMTDAIEGAGIAYWAEVKAVKRNAEGYVTSFEVRDGGYEGERVSDAWKIVNRHAVQNAVARLLSGEFAVRRDLAAQFVGEDWEYDQDGVDALIQAICFDELTFG
ncbi:MAG: hypothetical protein ING66_09435 [Rhodocyclaceae bacterium]|nr:hypothetical protein [Rhodocyclaceae bacterium]MCA3025350.1 hypothetical protein [Rhodocyclaceae bacterium]MCA3028808.1 hypothetical protein [Rhodocyclaceae bacterium]MCA3032926.1 hypothetical protein [Rhodocyclaceae bacterium]MCA3037367.1 hypothetical protein [Rhodocyclaceae bacterium]